MGSQNESCYAHYTQTWVDWAGSTMQVIDRDSGEILTAYLFVASLGTSGYPYVEAFQNQKLESWIMAHVHAFEYYGGIPRILVPDNLKTGIKKPCNYNPVENRTYFEMAEYYGTAIVPARVKNPETNHLSREQLGISVLE